MYIYFFLYYYLNIPTYGPFWALEHETATWPALVLERQTRLGGEHFASLSKYVDTFFATLSHIFGSSPNSMNSCQDRHEFVNAD